MFNERNTDNTHAYPPGTAMAGIKILATRIALGGGEQSASPTQQVGEPPRASPCGELRISMEREPARTRHQPRQPR